MRLPHPLDLGFPEKYADGWRPQQADALQWLLASTRRVKAPSMPTGSGKTGVVIGYALITKRPTCIVTENRGLQDLYLQDFSQVGLVDLRGRRNYACEMRSDFTCEEGYAARCPYKGSVACPASLAEMRAATSYLVVTNYDKWTAARKFGSGMQHFTAVTFDEGHESHSALCRAMQISLSTHEIEKVLKIDFPAGPEEFVNWKPWAVIARAAAENEMAMVKKRLEREPPKPTLIRHLLHMRNLAKRLATLSTARPENWIADTSDKGFVFDPVRVGRYGEAVLLLDIPNILIISATLRPKAMYLIGLGKDTFDYKEYPSDFPVDRCPVYYVPTLRVDSRVKDLSGLWMKLDQIAARRTDRKGMVHTVSYARRTDVLNNSRFSESMLVNERGDAATGLVSQFKRSGPGTILVSPSVGAGFDFPGRDCEWQLICKVPFPPSTKILKARQEADKEYGLYIAMNKLVQMAGRVMRSAEDQGETFLVDMHLEWFMKYKHLAPTSFLERFKRVETLPAPPPAL